MFVRTPSLKDVSKESGRFIVLCHVASLGLGSLIPGPYWWVERFFWWVGRSLGMRL